MDFLMQLNWIAIGQIILIDVLLGGDNAIVIALACRNLPANLRMKGIVWGTVGAVGIRIILLAFAVTLLQVIFVKMAGGLLLLWIGVKLLAEDDGGHDDIQASDKLFGAIRTIVIADLVMSIDNVIGVASAAEHAGGDHQLALVIFGIAVSIPIVIGGSTFVLKLMERFPIIVTFGSALLGYLAGGMIFSDAAIAAWVASHLPYADVTVPGVGIELSLPGLVGAIGVVLAGHWLARRQRAKAD